MRNHHRSVRTLTAGGHGSVTPVLRCVVAFFSWPSLHSRRGSARSAGLLVVLALGLTPCGRATLILDLQTRPDSPLNELSLQQLPGPEPEQRVYQSIEAVLRDRIEVRLPVEVELASVSQPAGWNLQFQQVTEDTGPVNLLTFYFVGNDASGPLEFTTLYASRVFRFGLQNASRTDRYPLSVPVTAYTSAAVPGSGLVPTITQYTASAIVDPESGIFLLHWPFEEGAGTNTTEAVSGETDLAHLVGPVAWTNGLAPGSGHAVFVAGTGTTNLVEAGALLTNGQYVAGTHPDHRVLDRWSITAWVELPDPQSTPGDRTIAASGSTAGPNGWGLFVGSAGSPHTLGFDFNQNRTYSGLEMPLDQPVFVAVLMDPTASSFGAGNRHRFVMWDGSTYHFSDGAGSSDIQLNGLQLGAWAGGTNPFHGTLDDVRIYGDALSQTTLDRLTQADTDGDGLLDFEDPDDDNDEVPDTDEETAGTNPKHPDTDGDGSRDNVEALFNTDPLDPTSFLWITELVVGDSVELRWTSESNTSYRILSTTDLVTGLWATVIGKSSVPATPPLNVETNLPLNQADQRRYYGIGRD